MIVTTHKRQQISGSSFKTIFRRVVKITSGTFPLNHILSSEFVTFSLTSRSLCRRGHAGRGDEDRPHQFLVQSVHWQHGRGLPVGEKSGREFEHLGEHGAHVCQDAGACVLGCALVCVGDEGLSEGFIIATFVSQFYEFTAKPKPLIFGAE